MLHHFSIRGSVDMPGEQSGVSGMKTIRYLTWFQMIELSSSSFFPMTFWIFPRIAVKYGHMDAQWSVIAVIIVSAFTGWIQGCLNERFPSITGADMHMKVYGKWLGRTSAICYLLVYIFFVALCAFFFTSAMKSFFPNTPNVFFVGALCLVGARVAWHGVESIARLASIIHPLTWLGLVVVFTFIILQAKWFWLPHTVTSWSNTFRGMYYVFPVYLGFNLVLMLSPYYEHKRRKSVWYPVISAAVSGIPLMLAFLAVVLTMGWEPARHITYSIPFVLQLVRMQGWIVERFGIMVVIFSTAFTASFISNHIWALSVQTARVFGKSDSHYKPYIFPIGFVVWGIAVFIQSEQQAFELVEKYLVPLSWILLLGSPILTLLIAMARRLRQEPVPVQKPPPPQ